MGSRHSGLTLAAGSGWTVINHYYNKSDKEASVLAFGHAWYSSSKWRFKVHGQLVPFVMPNPFSNQFATLANPRTLVVSIPPQQKFEVEAKNDSGNPHVYESILEYDGEPDVSVPEGEEVTTEAAVQQSWLVSMGEITTDLIPQLDATLSLGSSSKKWLNAYLANLYAGTLKQNLACDAGITIDGVDISNPITQSAQASAFDLISTASTSFVDMPNMSITLTTGAFPLLILFSTRASNSTSGALDRCVIVIDGVIKTYLHGKSPTADAGADGHELAGQWLETVSAGPHTIKIQWAVGSGTFYAAQRQLTVIELKR